MDDQVTAAALGNAAMRKAMWRIVPLILLAYLCAYMDRVNVSFAAAQMNVDLKFSATIYGLGGGLFFLGYALFEIPSNMLAVRFGSRRWLTRIMVMWGLLSSATMFVHTPLQFYTMRFLLGTAEAGFYPGVILYFGSWFPSDYRGRAVSRFYVSSPLASVVMGAVSGTLLGLDGLATLRGWQWLFLAQGMPSVVVGLIILRFLPDHPASVSWLSPDEKAWIDSELARDARRIGTPASHNPFASLHNPAVLLVSAIGFLYLGITLSVVLSAPMILHALAGLDTRLVGYVVTLGGVLGALTMLVAGNYADRHGNRFQIAGWLHLVMAGTLLAIALGPAPLIVVGAYLVFAATCFTIAMLVTSGWADVLHVSELAVGAAAINSLANLGSFAMPFAWGAARDATGGFTVGLLALALCAVAGALCTIPIRNRLRGHALVVAPA